MIQPGNSKLANQEGPVSGISRWSRKRDANIHVVDTTMRVTTPENISFQYEISGPFHRLLAYIFDVLLSLGGYFAVVVFLSLIFSMTLVPLLTWLGAGGLVQALIGVMSGMVAVGYFLVYWFYGAYTETYYNGQTLGKRMTGMRVISTDGHAIDGVQATLRNFFRLLDIMPLVPLATLLNMEPMSPGDIPDGIMDALAMVVMFPTCLFGLVAMMLSPKFQRLGDMVAGTVVISESRKHKPELAKFLDDRVPLLAELIPTSYVVPSSMASVIAEYVERRKYLPYQRVSEIASYLAGPLIEKFGLAKDTDHDLFLCALYYKTFVSNQSSDAPMSMMIPGSTTPVITREPIAVTAEPEIGQPTEIGLSEGSAQSVSGESVDTDDKFVLGDSDFRMDD